MRVLVTVEYNGTSYYGWQKQVDKRTIQENIETVLSKISNTKIVIHGSGRTDAGVHALGQTFHFDIEKENVDINQLLYAANRLLDDDIRLLNIRQIDDDMHARISVKEKVYEYRIKTTKCNVFELPYYEEVLTPLDNEKFKQALALFVGEHDFRNFTSKEEEEGFSFVRNIYCIDVKEDGHYITITLNGNGFMRYMIRFIIGTSLAVAKGQIDIEYIKSRLDNIKRDITSYKSHSKGLFLKEVKY